MKKIIALLIVISLALSGCTSVPASDTYKYADAWDPADVILHSQGHTDELDRYSKPIDVDLAPFKSTIRDYFSKNANSELLDWENFNQVEQVYAVGTDNVTDIYQMSEEFLSVMVGYRAMWDGSTNSIYLFPEFYELSAETQAYAIIHELLHSAFSTGHDSYSRLEEGVVDLYADNIMSELSLDCSPVYVGEVMAVGWLIEIFGENAIFTATRNATFDALIDGSTKDGMEAKLSTALVMVHNGGHGHDLTELVNVEYDILAHLAKNKGMGRELKSRLSTIATLYQGWNIDMDTKYLEKLL